MSACLLAHVNTSGVHIPIWLDSEGAIGWGQSTTLPVPGGLVLRQHLREPAEGLLLQRPRLRLGDRPGPPRRRPVQRALHRSVRHARPLRRLRARPSSSTTNGVADGYSACNGYTHVVTVWRNFDVNTQYKIVQQAERQGASRSRAAAPPRARRSSSARYVGRRTRSGPSRRSRRGKYKVVNVNSGKALDLTGGCDRRRHRADPVDVLAARRRSSGRSCRCRDQPGSYTITPSAKTGVDHLAGGRAAPPDGARHPAITYSTRDIAEVVHHSALVNR